MASTGKDDKFRGISLVGLSLGTFGLGVFLASRQNRRARLEPRDPLPRPAVTRSFSPHLYAFKALGIATVIVGITAVCTVKITTWYLDVHNVDEFQAKMKPFFRKLRPKGFQEVDPTKTVDWNEITSEGSQQNNETE